MQREHGCLPVWQMKNWNFKGVTRPKSHKMSMPDFEWNWHLFRFHPWLTHDYPSGRPTKLSSCDQTKKIPAGYNQVPCSWPTLVTLGLKSHINHEHRKRRCPAAQQNATDTNYSTENGSQMEGRTFASWGGHILEWAVHRGCVVSALGNTQNQTGHGLK